MISIIIFGLVIAGLVALLTVFADRFWPNTPASQIGFVCGLLIPGLMLLSYPAALIWIWMKPSGGFDTDGMTIVVIGLFVAAGMLASLFIGLPTSLAVIRYLRRDR
jgi:hypothetical protein